MPSLFLRKKMQIGKKNRRRGKSPGEGERIGSNAAGRGRNEKLPSLSFEGGQLCFAKETARQAAIPAGPFFALTRGRFAFRHFFLPFACLGETAGAKGAAAAETERFNGFLHELPKVSPFASPDAASPSPISLSPSQT